MFNLFSTLYPPFLLNLYFLKTPSQNLVSFLTFFSNLVFSILFQIFFFLGFPKSNPNATAKSIVLPLVSRTQTPPTSPQTPTQTNSPKTSTPVLFSFKIPTFTPPTPTTEITKEKATIICHIKGTL